MNNNTNINNNNKINIPARCRNSDEYVGLSKCPRCNRRMILRGHGKVVGGKFRHWSWLSDKDIGDKDHTHCLCGYDNNDNKK